MSEQWGGCPSYCVHGGICMAPRGHKGLHGMKYHTWTDAESISKEEADRIVLESGPGGLLILMGEALEELVGKILEDPRYR